LALAGRPGAVREPSRYPSSDIDLAFSVDEAVPADAVEAVLVVAAGELCESVHLFDVYRGPGVEPGRRSLAYRLRFCAADRTLTDAEVSDVRARCVTAVEHSFPAALRG
jgi:phenylalanyl-tRNA synthetase beta chain